MNGVDAFAAVAARPDLFADRVRYERYVAHDGIAGWCRKRGRDAWAHQTKGVEMADKTKDPYGFAKEKVDEAYVALYEALEALESVGADFCTDHGYNGDTMDGYGLLDVVSDISDSLEGM